MKGKAIVVGMTLALVSLGLIFLGCGGSQELAPYVVGGIFSISGPASYLGESERNSLQMVADEVNAEGGIDGHPLKLIIYNSEGDVTKARLYATRLALDKNILCVIGPSLTQTSMAALEITQKAKVPLISCAAGVNITSPVKERHWVFQTAQTDRMAVELIYQYLQKHHLNKVAILTVSTGFGVSGKHQLLDLAPRHDIQVVGQEVFGEKDKDMTSQLTTLRETPAQVIICWGTGPAPALVAKDMKELGMNLPLIQSHGAASKNFIELAGYAAEGIIMPAGKLAIWKQLPDTDPQKAVCKEYAEKYTAKFKTPESGFGGYAYDALRMLDLTLAKVGNNRAKIRDGIENTKNFVGVSGVFNMSPEDHNGLTPAALVLVKIHNGEFQLID
ncbi:MAG: ABC transporter substrate-binding protein [Deltaproteobacteria bacterium]|jgi:branched-chain amino acid transport system substrate-binding protein